MKYLTELEAWELIRNAYATEQAARSSQQIPLTSSGICKAIKELACDLSISVDTWDTMDRIVNAGVDGSPLFLYLALTRCPEGDAARVAFCDKQIKRLEMEVSR
jgi:hypothetical protein